jgi:transcriptional regulator with XRE-family HTH domain
LYRLLVDAGVPQRAIARFTGQSQSEVHDIVRGRAVKRYDVLVRIAEGLGVDRGAMGLAYAGRRRPVTSEEVDDEMLRRHFLAAATTALVGQPALGQLLTEPTPPGPGELPARLGASDVAAVEDTTRVLRDLSRRHGGHADTVSAVAQRASRLTSVPAVEQVRARLSAALGELHTLVGWCCYDAHDDGRAYRWQPPDEFDQADADHLAAKVQLQLGLLDSAEQFASTAARGWGDGARREALLTGITRAEIHLRAGEPDADRMASQVIDGAAGLRSRRAARRGCTRARKRKWYHTLYH